MNQQNNGTSVKVLAYSASLETHDKLLTLLVKFPRIIEPEVLRHRSLSFSAASSRAMNASGHIKKVTEDMFIPKFTKEQKGMSAKEYLDEEEQDSASLSWQISGAASIEEAKKLVQIGVHKQHATRLLQPFEYQEMIITGNLSSWEAFLDLRCPMYYIPGLEGEFYYSEKDVEYICKKHGLKGFNRYVHNDSHAQPEIQDLAEKIFNAIEEATPIILKEGQWHLPYGRFTDSIEQDIKINCAKCARISYLTTNEDWEKDFALYNKLVSQQHWSPLEHIARPLTHKECTESTTKLVYESGGDTHVKVGPASFYNLKGFVSQRFLEESKT